MCGLAGFRDHIAIAARVLRRRTVAQLATTRASPDNPGAADSALAAHSPAPSMISSVSATVTDALSAASEDVAHFLEDTREAATSKAMLMQAWWEMEGSALMQESVARVVSGIAEDVEKSMDASGVSSAAATAAAAIANTDVYKRAKHNMEDIQSRVVRNRDAMKTELHDAAIVSVSKVLGPSMKKVEALLKDLVCDSEMPRIVDRAANELVHNFVDSIRDEISRALSRTFMSERPDPRLHEEYKCCPLHKTCCGLQAVRAWILYHRMPYDRSVWGSLKDKWWWFLQLISVMPFWGLSYVYWLIVFLFLDKKDEFQLVDFIVTFKLAQCITHFALLTMLGGIRFTYCLQYSSYVARRESVWPEPLTASQIAAGKSNVFPDCVLTGQLELELPEWAYYATDENLAMALSCGW